MGKSIMANITVTFTITEFYLHTGVTEEELKRNRRTWRTGAYEDDNADWQFDDRAASVVQRAPAFREELALDWPRDRGSR